MSTPNLKKLLLPVAGPGKTADRWSIGWNDCLRVIEQNIEKLEAEAVEVFSEASTGLVSWHPGNPPWAKQRNWIFPSLTEEIRKGVTKDEIVKAFRFYGFDVFKDLADRIEQEGILP